MTPTAHRRRWRDVVNKQTFRARLQQNRSATANDDLGREITGALFRAIDREITRDTSLTPSSTVHFVMSSDHFQTRLAEALHMQAGVQLGPCGILVNIIYLSQFYFLPLIFTHCVPCFFFLIGTPTISSSPARAPA